MTGTLIPPPAGQDGAVPANDRQPAKGAAAKDAAAKGAAAKASAPAEPGRRGRPRSEEADRAILAAATELLTEHGLAGMSIEEVAARAGVARAPSTGAGPTGARWRSTRSSPSSAASCPRRTPGRCAATC